MKFYEIDPKELVPYGMPINSNPHVESKRFINEFFLKSFENYFKQLYTEIAGNLQLDYSRSCAAPESIYACRYCTNEQLKSGITGEGIAYYPLNDHDINAQLYYDLFHITYGTAEWANALGHYIANSNEVTTTVVPVEKPYVYKLVYHGNITDSVNTEKLVERTVENLAMFGTAHTTINWSDAAVIIEENINFEATVGAASNMASYFATVKLTIPTIPNVTFEDYWDGNTNNWLYSWDGEPISVHPGLYVPLAYNNEDTDERIEPLYDANCTYGVIQWQSVDGTTAGRTEFAGWNGDGHVAVKNVTENSYLSFLKARFAVADQPNVPVITVYDSSNNTYNAFAFILGWHQYYYVLDDSATLSWIDGETALNASGYYLEPQETYDEITLYCSADSSAKGCQGSITSSYNGIAKSAYLKNLYTQANTNNYQYYAIYDPEKRYEEGHYVDDVWTPYSNPTVADMPATTGSPYVGKILLYDYGRTTVWYVSNYPSDGAATVSSAQTTRIFRRYPLRAGIDYEYIDVLLHCSNNFNAQANFGTNDYWYSYMDADTVATVQAFGVTTETQSSGTSISAYNVRVGGFAFKILKLYSDQGVTEIETDVDNFYMNKMNNTTSGMLYICNKLALSGVCSYKCRIIKYL